MRTRTLLQRDLARRAAGLLPLLLGVTLISFSLTVHFGPDQTWQFLGKNPTAAEIEQVRRELGYDRPFVVRYLDYLGDLATFDLGHSQASGEPVADLLARSVPVSIMLLAPGFVLGLAIALGLGLWSAWRSRSALDHGIALLSAGGMSLSLVITIIALQLVFGVWLGWFPARGWSVSGPLDYLQQVAIPSLALILAQAGYNIRFFRAVFSEALAAGPVRTALAYGTPPRRILTGYVLRAAALPILTRIVFSAPLMLISGSLIIESHFGVPGVGKVAYDAIMTGDQPVLMAVVSLSAVLVALALTVADTLGRAADPRLRLS
jgi:peptide/nickel transport system permease protein